MKYYAEIDKAFKITLHRMADRLNLIKYREIQKYQPYVDVFIKVD